MPTYNEREWEQLGNYQLVRLLGCGGSAEVYLGRHLYLESDAAIKVLSMSLEDDEIARFCIEGQTLAHLRHSHIVRVLEFGVEQGTPFLVMDYAPNGTLRLCHPSGSCLPLNTVVTYVKDIASALHYAHSQGVIHCDVKPENMLLGEDQQVLLSDFGIALFARSLEQPSLQVAGTLPYMAPEQLEGIPCFATDQYALGIVVYEWLCGEPPFKGSDWQLFKQHLSDPPPPLREKNPSLPEAVEKVVLKALTKNPEDRYVDIQLFAQALEEASNKPVGEPRNPYKGLRAFTEKDSADFFGRETLIKDLVDAVKERLSSERQGISTARLLPVIGPSGSGKSSVVMAGLLPRLKQGALPGNEEWVYLKPMVPGAHPLEMLASTLALHLPERGLKSIYESLENDSAQGLLRLATEIVQGSERKVVLCIDQFEEVFNLTTSKDECERFFDLLLTAITERQGSVFVILTFRADFYHRLLGFSELDRLIQQHQRVVWPMEADELRAAIEGPAALPDVKLTFEGDLVGDLLYEIRGQVGALPLLEFALDQLFQRRQERLLPIWAYQQMGKVKGALAKHAEQIYQSLPTEAYRRLARVLFLRLLKPGSGEQDVTKRRVPLTEFMFVNPRETELLEELRATFTNARLLTLTNTVGAASTIEISHEALVGAWQRLGDWLLEERDNVRLQQKISEDAAEWRRRGGSVDWLYSGSQLERAQRWREANSLNVDEDAFLQASIEEAQRKANLEEVHREADMKIQRRNMLLSGLTIFTGVAAISTGGVAVVEALHNNLQSPSQAGPPSPPTYTYQGNKAAVNSVAWSQYGKQLASASSDNTVQVWGLGENQTLLTYQQTGAVFSVAWSPSYRVASSDNYSTIQVWDIAGHTPLFTYGGNGGGVNSIAWSPDGKFIASGDDNGNVQIWSWNTETNTSPLYTYSPSHNGAVRSVAWSPDGKYLASGSDDETVRIWSWDIRAKTGGYLCTYHGHTSGVNSVTWSPDGKYLASGSNDRTVQVWSWDVGAGAASCLFSYRGHRAAVRSVAWLDLIASAGDDTTVQVWGPVTHRRFFTHQGHSEAVNSIAWSPDGNLIASAGNDTTVQIWSPYS